MYAVFHGPMGLKAIAQRIHLKTATLAAGLEKLGFEIMPDTFFDTITIDVGGLQSVVMKSALNEGINLRAVGDTQIGIALDEMTTDDTLARVWNAFGLAKDMFPNDAGYRLPTGMARSSEFMTHSIFHMNRSEAEMTRYMRRLADRDLALDRAMIPLGSCTMKLNSAAEMMPITWTGFSKIHPFAPKSQTAGYDLMIRDLSAKLCEITGYDAISMQPNSGAQGEYAGRMTIRA
jgi:glycine dehydrogenase